MKIEVAQQLKTFLQSQRYGLLSTFSENCIGYPFGSIVGYDLAPNGSPRILVANIAEHYRNLIANSAASLCIPDAQKWSAATSGARATCIGNFVLLPNEERNAAENSYWQRFPTAAERPIAESFVFFTMEVSRIRWIEGFGKICWIEKDRFHEVWHN